MLAQVQNRRFIMATMSGNSHPERASYEQSSSKWANDISNLIVLDSADASGILLIDCSMGADVLTADVSFGGGQYSGCDFRPRPASPRV